MKSSMYSAATVAAAALVLTAWTSQARADEPTREPAASTSYTPPPVVVTPPPRDIITTKERTPNAGLITSGVMMFGIPYASSVIVAASSERAGDKNLYLPLVGPWMDLANRGHCFGPRCDSETS